MAAQNVVANPALLQQRLLENNVFATYAHPNSFAGYLALLFPMAIAWTLAGLNSHRRQQRKQREFNSFFSLFSLLPPVQFLKVALAAVGTLLIGLALWLTHSRGAILGSVLV